MMNSCEQHVRLSSFSPSVHIYYNASHYLLLAFGAHKSVGTGTRYERQLTRLSLSISHCG